MVLDSFDVLCNEVVHSMQHIDLGVKFPAFSNQVFFIFQLDSTCVERELVVNVGELFDHRIGETGMNGAQDGSRCEGKGVILYR